MYMVYMYIGKISLNFILSKDVQEFLVVDVGNLSTQGYWERYRPHNWKKRERKIMSHPQVSVDSSGKDGPISIGTKYSEKWQY